MRIQIWKSQLETYNLLMREEEGAKVATQLNMGEGKTQVIIPMVILSTIFGVGSSV